MNAQEFEKATGHAPEQDDLERANCHMRGHAGHNGCGVCRHGKPVFTCQMCFTIAAYGGRVIYQD